MSKYCIFNYISAFAALASIGSYVFSYLKYRKLDKKQVEQQILINEFKLKECEKKQKALIDLKYVSIGGGHASIRVINDGLGEAYNVKVHFNTPIEEIHHLKDSYDFNLIGPGQKKEIDVKITKDSPRSIGATISWEDSSTKNNTSEKTLQF